MKIFSKKNIKLNKIYKGVSLILIILLILCYLYINSSLFYRIKLILPFSLHLNKQELILTKGEEYRLFVYGINKWVSYSSTNFRVAGVDFAGRVFAYQTGKAFIIAKVDNKKLKCRVKVIDLNKKKLNLDVGKSFRLRIKGPAVFARYKSNYPKVASVNKFGKVQANKPGKAIITVKVKGKILKCRVTVN
ncbi:MAG: hypothetical protein GX321_07570 [Clostridiales bacterium]|nr:hypothetical protein [Clostridiales bacterium]